MACGAWAVQTQGAELGGECSFLQGCLRVAVLGIPGGAGAPAMTENSVSRGRGCVLMLSPEWHPVTNHRPV